MPFAFDLSPELKAQIFVLVKMDKKRAEALQKKIKQIVALDAFEIEHFKNLRYNLSDCKRVHIDKHFVLLFQVFKKENFILFVKFWHHDHIYQH